MDTMTMKGALKETFGILAGVNVKVADIQQIGIPIMRAMENIAHIIEAIHDNKPEDVPALTEEDV